MAVFNEILAGRLNRAIQKFTGIKGGPPTRQLSSEMMPVFPFFWGSENRYLEGWIKHSCLSNFSASAGNLNASMLRNPVGSNVIMVLEKLVLLNNAAAAQDWIMSQGPRTTDLTTVVSIPSPSNFDARYGSTTRSGAIFSTVQTAGPGTAPPDRLVIGVPAQTSTDLISDGIQEWPLLPGWAVSIRSTVVNQGDAHNYWWRERPLEDSELT